MEAATACFISNSMIAFVVHSNEMIGRTSTGLSRDVTVKVVTKRPGNMSPC